MRCLLRLAFCAAVVLAHGTIWKIQFGSDPPLVIGSPYKPNATAAQYGRPVKSTSPIFDLASDDSACNVGQGGKVKTTPYAVAAGANVTFFWDHNTNVSDPWTTSHRGPVLTYMAACGADCSNVVAASRIWFKIDEAGVDVENHWASIWLSEGGSRWTVALPKALKSGRYLIRHEILSLHKRGSPQPYMACFDIDLRSSESSSVTSSSDLVAIPGVYDLKEPGLSLDIYKIVKRYTIPGGPVWAGCRDGSCAVSSKLVQAVPGDGSSSSSGTSRSSSMSSSPSNGADSSPTRLAFGSPSSTSDAFRLFSTRHMLFVVALSLCIALRL